MEPTVKLMKNIILFLLPALFLISCSKYPEGPEISLRGKRGRLEGQYSVTSFTAGEINLLNYQVSGTTPTSCGPWVDYNELYYTRAWLWNFSKSGGLSTTQSQDNVVLDYDQTYTYCTLVHRNDAATILQTGTWEFSSNKKQLLVTFAGNPTVGMDIRELRHRSMHLQWNDNGVTYNLILEE